MRSPHAITILIAVTTGTTPTAIRAGTMNPSGYITWSAHPSIAKSRPAVSIVKGPATTCKRICIGTVTAIVSRSATGPGQTSAARSGQDPTAPGSNGQAPELVEVILTHGNYCILTALDDAGTVVDTATAAAGSAVQTLTLVSADGIRSVEIEGSEINMKETWCIAEGKPQCVFESY